MEENKEKMLEERRKFIDQMADERAKINREKMKLTDLQAAKTVEEYVHLLHSYEFFFFVLFNLQTL